MEKRRYTYPKSEKLKSRNIIEKMFAEGKTVSKYPLRLVYVPLQDDTEGILKMGVSVSKRNFKRAVDRNYYKRLLREAYRLNKHIITEKLQQPTAFMFFYQTKDRLTFEEVNEKAIQLFEKFLKQEGL
ncbi:ribonuclease P protein component [Flavobacterium sp. D11R37]|uniref:ribonuclease P protein component n=1 Tax=Flavobacterium coralii TaxID=2838017 RepID=UPI001CA6C6C4|nr:ribonuclease P protein component [Flavobacterium coralii]MBY8963372.1 ribonuclease P protein component [Flavobacterium coralii]